MVKQDSQHILGASPSQWSCIRPRCEFTMATCDYLPFLQSLPTQRGELGIVQRCAANYSHLGIFLLNDDDRTKIRRIELANHYKPEAIMMAIFEEWIASGNNSWKELIECLRMCSLNTLARDIRDALRHNEVSV